MTYPTLKDLIDSWGNVLPAPIIQSLLKTSGIMQTAMFTPSTHGAFDKIPVFESLPTASFKAMNGSTTPTAITQAVKQADLIYVKATEHVDADYIKSYKGGIQAYTQSRMPAMTQSIMNKLAQQVYYGATAEGDTAGFNGLREIAIDNSNYDQIDETDVGTSTYSSLTAVKWNDSLAVVYDPAAMDAGNIVKFEVSGPQFLTSNTSTGAAMKVYVLEAYSMLALRVADPSNVYSLVNVEVGTNDVTYAKLTQMLDAVRATSGDTVIYCSRPSWRSINSLKLADLDLGPNDPNYTAIVNYIDNIPVVLDENIKSTEDFVS